MVPGLERHGGPGHLSKRDQPGGYDAYSEVLAHFIRDVRRDLNTPDLPFVIGVLGVGGPTSEYLPEQKRYQRTHENFRAAMAAPAQLPEFRGTVTSVLTENYWDQELTRARAKEGGITNEARKLAKEQNLKPAEEKNLLEKMRAEGLTERAPHPREGRLQRGIPLPRFRHDPRRHRQGPRRGDGRIGNRLNETEPLQTLINLISILSPAMKLALLLPALFLTTLARAAGRTKTTAPPDFTKGDVIPQNANTTGTLGPRDCGAGCTAINW